MALTLTQEMAAALVTIAKGAAGDTRFVVGKAPLGYEITSDVNGNIEVGGVPGKTLLTILLVFAALGVWKSFDIATGRG